MITIKLSEKERNLVCFILSKTLDYGWESCLGGHEEGDKIADNKYHKERKETYKILKKIELA